MDAPKLVTLVDPKGVEVQVSEPADINNLVFGQGYKVKGKQTPEDALGVLAENPTRAAEAATTTTTEVTTAK